MNLSEGRKIGHGHESILDLYHSYSQPVINYLPTLFSARLLPRQERATRPPWAPMQAHQASTHTRPRPRPHPHPRIHTHVKVWAVREFFRLQGLGGLRYRRKALHPKRALAPGCRHALPVATPALAARRSLSNALSSGKPVATHYYVVTKKRTVFGWVAGCKWAERLRGTRRQVWRAIYRILLYLWLRATC